MIGAVTLEANSEQPQLAALIDRRYFEAYKKSPVWPRYMVSGEPRTLGPDQVVPFTEDSFFIHASGTPDVHGLYTYGPEYNNHNSYILNGSSLSFEVAAYPGYSFVVGTYKFDPNYQISNSYDRGVWQNQTNPNIVFAKGSGAWVIYEIVTGSTITGNSPAGYFPWQTSQSGLTFGTVPKVAYNIERNAANNHWELMKQESSGTAAVIYKDGNGNIPSETAWQIVNGSTPAPIVHDVDDISDFIRVHKTQSFLNKSAQEYDYYVDPIGAHLMNVTGSTGGIAYVTYKKKFTPFNVTTDYYNDNTAVPEEFFNYIAHAAYADFLRIQGQAELAQTEGALAEKYLEMELEKLNNINSLNAVRRISTHVSRQSRTQ
jgi:hypothetical protein